MTHTEPIPSAEHTGERRTVHELRELLDTPEHRDKILFNLMQSVTRCLNLRMATQAEREAMTDDDKLDAYGITPKNFAELYDPSLPTIAIDFSNSFSGAELVALAAARRRQQGKPSVNIILTASHTSAGSIAVTDDGNCHFEVSHGVMIGPDQTVYWGQLPTPVLADTLETTNSGLLRQCAEQNIATLNSHDLVESLGSKTDLANWIRSRHVRTPRRFTPAEMWQTDPNAAYVIKPSNGSGGRGVQFYDQPGQAAEAQGYFEFLEQNGYHPIIEERIKSIAVLGTEIHGVISLSYDDPSDGPPIGVVIRQPVPRQDWNVRALIANKELVDMYVRVGDWNTPINTSNGARTMSMADFAERISDPDLAATILKKLERAGHALAKNIPTGFGGADITIDEDLGACAFEVNVGNSGGLQTIALLHDDAQQKLAGPDRLVEGWLRHPALQPERPGRLNTFTQKLAMGYVALLLGSRADLSKPVVIDRAPLRHSVTALNQGLNAIEQPLLLSRLPEHEIATLHPTSYEWSMWAELGYLHAKNNDKAGRLQQLNNVDQIFMRLAPLEFSTEITNIALLHADPEHLAPYIEIFQKMFPRKNHLDAALVVIHSAQGDLSRTRAFMNDVMPLHTDNPQAILGAGILGSTMAIRKMLDAEPNDGDLDTIAQIFETYYTSNYTQAIAKVRDLLAETSNQDELCDMLHIAGFQLAMAERDLAAVAEFAKLLQDIQSENYIFRTVGHPEPRFLNDTGWQQARITALAAINLLGDTIAPILRHAKDIQPAHMPTIAAACAELFAKNYGEEARASEFADFLATLAHQPDHAQAMSGQDTLALVSQLLWASYHNVGWQKLLVDRVAANQKLSESDRSLFMEHPGTVEFFFTPHQ